jgi:hypothetical protein
VLYSADRPRRRRVKAAGTLTVRLWIANPRDRVVLADYFFDADDALALVRPTDDEPRGRSGRTTPPTIADAAEITFTELITGQQLARRRRWRSLQPITAGPVARSWSISDLEREPRG